MTRRSWLGFTLGSRRCGAAAFAASFGRKPYGAAAAAHGSPGDRPPAVPPVSRCRARQHHGQAVTLAPGAPVAGECHSRWVGTPRIVRVGPSSVKGTRRSFLTASQKRSPGPALERRKTSASPAGLDGEGQARGQARSARGEPGRTSIYQETGQHESC